MGVHISFLVTLEEIEVLSSIFQKFCEDRYLHKIKIFTFVLRFYLK